MGHRDYCARMDDEQLGALIREAESRLKTIKEAGYARVWADYAGALAELANQARRIACDTGAKSREVTLEILSMSIPAGELNGYLSHA
jgi:hypothetical protein